MSDIRLTVAVSHTPWDAQRRGWVYDIRREFREAKVVEDTLRKGYWNTVRRAWNLAGRGTHHLVLADDMVPPRGANEQLIGAIEAKPDACLCLFTMRRCTREAVEQGKHWAVTPDGVWGGAILMPTSWVTEWLAWDRANVRPDYGHDDVRIALWLVATKRKVWHTAPSLVEHVGAAFGLHPNKNRIASVMMRPNEQIDWKQGLTDPLVDPHRTRSVEAKEKWQLNPKEEHRNG